MELNGVLPEVGGSKIVGSMGVCTALSPLGKGLDIGVWMEPILQSNEDCEHLRAGKIWSYGKEPRELTLHLTL